MKYRKKPVVIDAIQFCDDADTLEKISKFVNNTVTVNFGCIPPEIKIETLEGTMEATLGDYIIKGVKGEFYACKPDIFLMSYEAVEE